MASQAEIELMKLMQGGKSKRIRSRADALLGVRAPEPQMVGGRYIAPSRFGSVAAALTNVGGALLGAKADREEGEERASYARMLQGAVSGEKAKEAQRYADAQEFKRAQLVNQDRAYGLQEREFGASQSDRARARAMDEQRLELERARMGQDNWTTGEDSVSGGLFKLNKRTGEMVPVTGPGQAGGKVAPPAKMTEGQAKAFDTAARMHDDLGIMKAAGPQEGARAKFDALATGLYTHPAGWLIPRGAASDEGQKYFSAARDLVAAQLRKESGGAITGDEWKEFGPLYVPMPGDTPEVKATKIARLEKMIASYEIQSGGQGARYLEAQRQQAGQAQQSGLPAQSDPAKSARFNSYLGD